MDQPYDIEPETAGVAAEILRELETLAALAEPSRPAKGRFWRRPAGREEQPTGAA